MLRYIKIFFALTLLTAYIDNYAQQIGFDFPNGEKKVFIKFERYNNLIVIPVLINNNMTLKFILDTGVQYPIITEKKLADFMGLNYTRRITIESPGVIDSISAVIVPKVSLKLPGGVKSGINQALLILEKDYLKLKENLGADIYGLIGYSIFSRFVVEIDNDNMQIILHEPSIYHPKKFRTKVPLKIVNTKPYVDVSLVINDSTKSNIKMLIDTGASHAILLDEKSDGIFLPSKTISNVIGKGLGGDIHGVLGRISCFSIGRYYFKNLISSFPTDEHYGNALLRGSRNGTIGGEILSRFNIIFDYSKNVMYLKKSNKYYEPFEYDMSGIDLIVDNKKKRYMKVHKIRKGSPADEVGIKKGDIITMINGFSIETTTFNHIISLLRQKEGKKIIAKILRNNEKLKFSFKLKKVI